MDSCVREVLRVNGGPEVGGAEELELELPEKDGSPLRNALREYLKSYNGIIERKQEVAA